MFREFLKDTGGSTAIEYGLIAALISIGIIPAGVVLSDKIAAFFMQVAATFL